MARTMLILLLAAACASEPPQQRADATPHLGVPAWAADAIWYQIFVERFRNGDPSNDPTVDDIAGVTDEPAPDGWRPTPWGQDWYRQEPWAAATGRDFYATVNFRRYGGDLQGVLDRLDYLQDLGVTALYLNPVNDAPSLHKYDARNYHHVDRNFGPDPRGDEAHMAAEDPTDPSTWGWTAADSLFLVLVKEVHRRGMRIIVDYSWNHTGITFWAWRDVLERQRASRFADWYEIERFDDPATRDTNEFAYRGWVGVPWSRSGRRWAGRRGRRAAPSRATSCRRSSGTCSTSRAAGSIPTAMATRRTAWTASGSTWRRWCPSASGVTIGASSGASTPRHTWWARCGGSSGRTGCTTRRRGSRATCSTP